MLVIVVDCRMLTFITVSRSLSCSRDYLGQVWGRISIALHPRAYAPATELKMGLFLS